MMETTAILQIIIHSVIFIVIFINTFMDSFNNNAIVVAIISVNFFQPI